MKWNIRERAAELREGLVHVVRRHPLELLLLLALTVTLIVCLESNRDPGGARCVVLGWGALLLLIVNRLTMHTRLRILYWVAWVALVPLFFWSGFSDWLLSAQGVVSMGVLTPLALLASRRAVANDRFVTDALVCLRAAVLALFFAGVAYALFEAILWSTAYIFGFNDARWVDHLTAELFFVTLFLAAPTLFMMMLDRWEETQMGSSRVLEVLVNWIITPAVIIYAAILYLYLLKILVTWTLPEGGVAYLVFGFTMAALLVKALWMQLDKRRGGWFYDRFSLLSLPIVALFWVGVARRVGEYGLTEARIYLLLCGGVMTLCILLFLSRRAGRYLWVVLAAFAAFAAVAYVPALEPGPLALRSQSRRAVRIAAELGRLDAAGRLSPEPVPLADTAHRREYRELYEALQYVERDSAAFARFGVASSDDLVTALPSVMRDYVQWGWEPAVGDAVVSTRSVGVNLPRNACIEVDGRYSRSYVNLAAWDSESYSFERNTLRFRLGREHPVLEIAGRELLERQLAAGGYALSQGVDPTPEQALRILDYRDGRCRILFESMEIVREDSLDVLLSVQVHSLWLR